MHSPSFTAVPMPTIRRRKRPRARMDGSAQVFPDDVVLEIVARCPTVADVIRWAATSKPIRRGILNATFLRRLLRDGREEDGHGPSVLLGLYHRSDDDPDRQLAFVPAPGCAENRYPPSVTALPPAPPNHHASACRYGAYLPVASRCSLLLLRRQCSVREKEHLMECHGPYPVELSACNPVTGERSVLPPYAVRDTSHAVLDVDPLAPSSAFKLLVAELTEHAPRTLYVQIFSSESEERDDWGPVTACRIARGCEFVPGPAGRPGPVVLGGTVNWLCTTDVGHRILSWRWRGDGGGDPQKASLVKLPSSSLVCWDVEMRLAVSPSTSAKDDNVVGPRALLSLIVLERGDIWVWVRKKSGRRLTWALRHRIQGTDIARPMGLGDGWLCGKELASFSEGSGRLLLPVRGKHPNHLLVDLDYNMAVSKPKATSWDLPRAAADFCPYEIDLLSYMLFVMKTFTP